MIVAGLGFRKVCTPDAMLSLLRRAAERAGVVPDALAIPAFKTASTPAATVARQLNLPLVLVTNSDLAAAQPRCITRSAVAQAATGHASVAEAAALAAAGPSATLILTRIGSGPVTCALARGEARPTGPQPSSQPGPRSRSEP